MKYDIYIAALPTGEVVSSPLPTQHAGWIELVDSASASLAEYASEIGASMSAAPIGLAGAGPTEAEAAAILSGEDGETIVAWAVPGDDEEGEE